MRDKITLERYLYLKGLTTRSTSNIKIKANKGIARAFNELFFENFDVFLNVILPGATILIILSFKKTLYICCEI